MNGDITPDVFTTDYLGEPGERTFFIQAANEAGAWSFLVEKQQVALLAERLREVLLLVDPEDTVNGATPARDPALRLVEPAEPEWRVGTMGLAYDEDDDRVVVFAQPADAEDSAAAEDSADDEDLVEQEPDDTTGVRFLLRRDQARAFVLHAIAVIGEGRAICPLCGLPMSPSGHECPSSNGHHVRA